MGSRITLLEKSGWEELSEGSCRSFHSVLLTNMTV